MAVKKIRKYKPKPRPKPVINYPPVPTKKWIPPEKRSHPKPEPKYVKPEGISQKLAISTLNRVWNKFNMYGDAGILCGHFSQSHKRFTFKSNGLQGACNSAIACIYSQLYKMAFWTKRLLDEILIKGDELYARSTQLENKCLVEVSPEKVNTSFFLNHQKITLIVSPDDRVTEELTSTSEDQAKLIIGNVVKKFLDTFASGIFYIMQKYVAVWIQDGVYYMFDPEEHDEFGNPWTAGPGCGCGGTGGAVSFLGRFKKVSALAKYIFNNFPSITESHSKFHIIPCGIARIVNINVNPPETLKDLEPQDVVISKFIEQPPPPPDPKREVLVKYVEESAVEADPILVQMQELSPDVGNDLPPSRRPSFLVDKPVDKNDFCRYPIPVPTYLKGENARLTYYTELSPKGMGILRGNTCQTDPNYSKYLGRQSMGNALSALIMLRICKSKHWVPSLVDNVLKYGETLYRDAMLSIPRTHSLRLANFPTKIEYEGKNFTPDIDEYAVVGQMQSQDYDILDLGPALDDFLADHGCCVVLGPQILAVWVEDGLFYMFDPNERDREGKAIVKTAIVGSNIVNLEPPSGVACVVWCQDLTRLVDLYVQNTEKLRRSERFYLSKVVINDFFDVSEEWYNFKGIDIGKWILRGTFNQGSFRFSPESRNTQGTANALITLAMTVLFDEQEWSSDTVDEILMTGDKFYLTSVADLQEKNLYTDPHLMLSELNQSLPMRKKQVEFELEECVVNGLIGAQKTNDLSDLFKGLDIYFRDHADQGVLTTRDISLSFWKKNGAFYYFDPYSRNEKGVAAGYGTSCTVRLLQIEDLARSIEANLDPNAEDFFNISKVKITLYEAGAGGTAKPPLNHYTAINEKSAILRSWLSEQSEKYEIRKGRQTVAMCVSAVGLNKLKPSPEWTKNDMDFILDKGDELYMESMAKAQEELDKAETPELGSAGESSGPPPVAEESDPVKAPPKPLDAGQGDAGSDEKKESEEEEEEVEEEEEEVEEEEELPEVEIKITSEKVKPELNIGPNNITVELTSVAEGNIKETLKDSLMSYFGEQQTDENFNQEVLLETKHYTVAMWRDSKAYYVFDPRPRDKNGEVIGKADWDPEPPVVEPEPTIIDTEENSEEETELPGEGTELEEDAEMNEPQTDDDADEEGDDNEVANIALDYGVDNEEEGEDEEEEGEEEEEEEALEESIEEEVEEEEPEEVVLPCKPKKSPSYWEAQERTGRACTVWFTDPNDLANFVYENIPVKDRLKTDFVLSKVTVFNNLNLKNKYNREDERPDAYAGDWYDFKELEQGKWILRASLDLTHELFPESNRGKQSLTCSILALGIAHTYEMTCFTDTVPDTIIVYGDKLLTFMKRNRKKQLRNDPKTNLKEDEIDWLVQHEDFKITDVPKKICVSKFMVELDVVPNVVMGDTKAQNFEDVLDVKRGLEKFFEDSSYGVLVSKGLYVAVWKGQKMYFMGDGMKRGPNGIHSTIGTGCITRYMEIEKLADVFLQNLPVYGKSEFFIHKVTLKRNLCPRDREPREIIPAPKAVPKSAGLKLVVPGKNIIRGTISQEDPRFGKGPNVMSAPIAVVALTMSLIHKTETWSRPILDDIVISGSELYEDSVNELGFDFNPWEDKLDVYRVKNDFKVGMVKANCELRSTDQRGYIDVKDSFVQNLRQGMERFFEENTHGILVTEPLTLAMWEQKQEEGKPLIFIFDPNPRSSTGMPLFSGAACVLSFVNAKMASDHIIGCILEPSLRAGDFIIVPVEIVVGKTRTTQKQPEKSPTRSSINVLPRCSKTVLSEQKRKLRKLAEEDRKRKEAKKQQMIGRNGYHLKGGEAILRGYKSQNSVYFSPETRDKQDIPNCIASVVMHSLLSIDDWNYRHIDLILDTGDQLYIDSYIAYGPKDPQLGMQNILRKFFMGCLEVHVTVYKPIVTEVFTPSKLYTVFEAFFQQETVCILNYSKLWISVFFKAGFYFMFDPHERDMEGNSIKNKGSGTGVVVRFDNLNTMALKIVNNLGGLGDETETFSLWIISVESK